MSGTIAATHGFVLISKLSWIIRLFVHINTWWIIHGWVALRWGWRVAQIVYANCGDFWRKCEKPSVALCSALAAEWRCAQQFQIQKIMRYFGLEKQENHQAWSPVSAANSQRVGSWSKPGCLEKSPYGFFAAAGCADKTDRLAPRQYEIKRLSVSQGNLVNKAIPINLLNPFIALTNL